MDDKKGNDLTVGSIPTHIVKFAVPMMIGLFLSMGYSIINTIWIGNLLGKEAMGASAVSFPITFILIAIASGSTTATSILVSQYYGSKNFKMVEKVIENSWYIFSINAVFLTIVAIIFRKGLLSVMRTPIELFNMASDYLLISLLGFFVTYIFYIISSIMSGMGDTKTPVFFLVISTIINALLDPFFIMKLGLNGAAFASLISGIIAFVAVAIYLSKNKYEVSLIPKKINFNKYIGFDIVKLGMPSVIQQCLMPISLIFITSFINRFGSDAVAAYGAASKIDYLAIIPGMAMGTAASVITGQNIGAGKFNRVREVFKWGIIINFTIVLSVACLVMIFPKEILSIFVRDNRVLEMGTNYLKINSIGYCIFSISYISNGIINGSRKTVVTMTISFISLILLRIPLSNFMSKSVLGIRGIWLAILITYIVTTICSVIYYFSGAYKKERLNKMPKLFNNEIESVSEN